MRAESRILAGRSGDLRSQAVRMAGVEALPHPARSYACTAGDDPLREQLLQASARAAQRPGDAQIGASTGCLSRAFRPSAWPRQTLIDSELPCLLPSFSSPSSAILPRVRPQLTTAPQCPPFFPCALPLSLAIFAPLRRTRRRRLAGVS